MPPNTREPLLPCAAVLSDGTGALSPLESLTREGDMTKGDSVYVRVCLRRRHAGCQSGSVGVDARCHQASLPIVREGVQGFSKKKTTTEEAEAPDGPPHASTSAPRGTWRWHMARNTCGICARCGDGSVQCQGRSQVLETPDQLGPWPVGPRRAVWLWKGPERGGVQDGMGRKNTSQREKKQNADQTHRLEFAVLDRLSRRTRHGDKGTQGVLPCIVLYPRPR